MCLYLCMCIWLEFIFQNIWITQRERNGNQGRRRSDKERSRCCRRYLNLVGRYYSSTRQKQTWHWTTVPVGIQLMWFTFSEISCQCDCVFQNIWFRIENYLPVIPISSEKNNFSTQRSLYWLTPDSTCDCTFKHLVKLLKLWIKYLYSSSSSALNVSSCMELCHGGFFKWDFQVVVKQYI